MVVTVHRDDRAWTRSKAPGPNPHPLPAAPKGPKGGPPGVPDRRTGTLAMLFGSAGVLVGLVGAATFLPYAGLMGSQYESLAGLMTVFSLVGMEISALGIVAGLGLSRGWSGAPRTLLGIAGSLAFLAAVMGALYPIGFFLLILVVPTWGFVALRVLLRKGGAAPVPPAGIPTRRATP